MEQTFSGGVFSDSLDGGRAGAEIELMPSGVGARTPDGEAFVIPYRDCQVEVGGFSGRMVFCRSADRSLTIFCEESKFPKALSFASSGMLDDQLKLGAKQRRSESRRGLLIGTFLTVGFLLLVVGGYFTIRSGARAAVLALPVSIDAQIGDAAMDSMDLGGPEVDDPVVIAALESIVDRLAPTAAVEGIDFRVHVVDSPEVNAFALPGGNMVVYTGLIRDAETAEQMAAVLAHEMSHATLRHGLQRIGQSLGIWAGVSLLIGDLSGLMGAGVDMLQIASVNSYSRAHENEADEEGIRMLYAAEINPAAMADLFQLMKENQAELPGIFSWVSTHPDHASRIANVHDQVAALPPRKYREISVDWPEVKRRINQDDNRENAEVE
ncbi:M48 family metallopeptidase [Aporhodopirellula aestuarii]|uniref:M48 family metallopeptidase n=1 Tax=Aporhodopirellula aestuarii TaxID=2950107 RepID=A0ABT0U5I3_9BACT|nr:M48 family metallopeptidase [Aporhodopirellula aestuarii]MCM2371815.1 M48 family metallopeptidase [Aporhodopirellula aestuarii]